MEKGFTAKYHALGNDYIVVDPAYLPMELSRDNIRLLCDRHFGMGSDGILYGPLTLEPPYWVRIFNPDGSEAEKSGNGVRIFSRYLDDAGYLHGADTFDLMTNGGVVHVKLLGNDLIQVDMGTVSFFSKEIPVGGARREVVDEEIVLLGTPYRMTCATIGNPHCVIPVDKATCELAKTLGTIVETHPLFPNRINMQLLEIINRHEIKIEIWERGAGYTLASGSSSCAAAAAARRLGLVEPDVLVIMPGGELDIRVGDSVLMTGPVSPVYEGRLSQPFLTAIGMP